MKEIGGKKHYFLLQIELTLKHFLAFLQNIKNNILFLSPLLGLHNDNYFK